MKVYALATTLYEDHSIRLFKTMVDMEQCVQDLLSKAEAQSVCERRADESFDDWLEHVTESLYSSEWVFWRKVEVPPQ